MLATQHWTPLRWWSATDLADLSRGLDSAVNGWREGWFVNAHGSIAGSRCEFAHQLDECPNIEWHLLGRSSDAAAWISVPVDAREDMRVSLFGGENGSIAADVAQTACIEYEEALRTFLRLLPAASRETPAAGMLRPWNGAALAELSWVGGERCLLLMNAECVTQLLGEQVRPKKSSAEQPSELVSCALALASTKVTLSVGLDSCELEIGNLAALQIGDVIPWPHALEHPLHVCTDDGAQICSGHLGRIGSSKAVELLA